MTSSISINQSIIEDSMNDTNIQLLLPQPKIQSIYTSINTISLNLQWTKLTVDSIHINDTSTQENVSCDRLTNINPISSRQIEYQNKDTSNQITCEEEYRNWSYFMRATVQKNGIPSVEARQIKFCVFQQCVDIAFLPWRWKGKKKNSRITHHHLDQELSHDLHKETHNSHMTEMDFQKDYPTELSSETKYNAKFSLLMDESPDWEPDIENDVDPINNSIWTVQLSCFVNFSNRHCPIFTIEVPWPPPCYVPESSFVFARLIFGPFTRQFALLPNSPVSPWLSQIFFSDLVWVPRDETCICDFGRLPPSYEFYPRVRYSKSSDNDKKTSWNEKICQSDQSATSENNLSNLMKKTPWKERSPRVSETSLRLVRKILCLGAFLLPHGPIYFCAAPQQRFCIDLQNASINFLKSRKLRKQFGKFRISVNRAFPEALRLSRIVHFERSGSTWITEELSEMMYWFVYHETAGNAKHDTALNIKQSVPKTTVNSLKEENSTHTNEVKLNEEKIEENEKLEKIKRLTNLGQPELKKESSFQKNWYEPIESIDDDPNLFPPIRMYSFELWDIETHSLVAATFTYVVGNIASDFTCLTVERDHRSCGTLLALLVAETLKRLGVILWWWGKELSYMTQFGKSYGGISLGSEEFYEKWWSEALGCQRCKKPMEFGKHRRVQFPCYKVYLNSPSQLTNQSSIEREAFESLGSNNRSCSTQHEAMFLCETCSTSLVVSLQDSESTIDASFLKCLIPDVEHFIEQKNAPVLPLDFTPTILMPNPL